MSFFNGLYTLSQGRVVQPIGHHSNIGVEFDNPSSCNQITRWAKWAVSFPVHVAHGAFNTVYMMITKDIHKVISSQVYNGNSIHRLQFLWGISGHVVTSSKVMAAITSHYRHDVEGPFQRENDDPFTPILKDLYKQETVSQEDFLLTCSRSHVKSFRDPILNYLGPKALPQLRPQIDRVSDEVLDAIALCDTISAKYLAEMYTVAILARLFLNHPGTLRDFQNIGRAASRVVEYQYLKRWGRSDQEQSIQYVNDLQILRDAVEHSSGEFISMLRQSGLTPLQIKGELLLVYVAGSETTSSVLQYVLWRLGQHSDLQEEIRNKPDSVVQFMNDCLMEYTPVTFFSRFAKENLVISVENPDGTEWKYPIAEGEALIMAPSLAKSSVFGAGVHSCPGQWLARAELCSIVLKLVSRYDIISFPKKHELTTIPGFGFLKVEPVDLTLLKRQSGKAPL